MSLIRKHVAVLQALALVYCTVISGDIYTAGTAIAASTTKSGQKSIVNDAPTFSQKPKKQTKCMQHQHYRSIIYYK